MKNLAYLVALQSVDGLGPVRLKLLLDYFQDPALVWNAQPAELAQLGIFQNVLANLGLAKKKIEPEKYLEGIIKQGVKIVTIFDQDYPEPLRQLYDPPIVFYYLGQLPASLSQALAVVGTRKISGYGRIITDKFSFELAEAGLIIISGLAFGVDTVAHQSALKAKAVTVAVLGGGFDHLYPRQNQALAKNIAAAGGAIISEYPPEALPIAGHFPARNRLIAGLAQGVLVTEAAEDSGSLITARAAVELGKDVFAVPGPITSETSIGTAELIKQGAQLVTRPAEILATFGLVPTNHKPAPTTLTPIEQTIINYLHNEPHHVDEICRRLNQPSSQINAALIKMELSGLVKNLGGGIYLQI